MRDKEPGQHQETRDIRLANLCALSSAYKKINLFCERIDMNPTYYSQLKSGRKAIGDDLARRIEEKLGLPRGYMDTPKIAGTSKGEQSQQSATIPSETLGVAYALECLSEPVRGSLTRLIYTLAAQAADIRTEQSEKSVKPFSITIGAAPSDESSSVDSGSAQEKAFAR